MAQGQQLAEAKLGRNFLSITKVIPPPCYHDKGTSQVSDIISSLLLQHGCACAKFAQADWDFDFSAATSGFEVCGPGGG